MFTSVIMVAAGRGTRIPSSVAKQFLPLSGKPVLAHSLEKFEAVPEVDEIILVTGAEDIDACQKEIIEKYAFTKVRRIVSGGADRQSSVERGLAAASTGADVILVHDGVRPFVETEHIRKIIALAGQNISCVLGVKVKDTVKRADPQGVVVETPQRESLWAVQTPQGFPAGILRRAYGEARKRQILGTDESSLVEAIGCPVRIVEGSYANIKITTPEDLAYAELIVR